MSLFSLDTPTPGPGPSLNFPNQPLFATFHSTNLPGFPNQNMVAQTTFTPTPINSSDCPFDKCIRCKKMYKTVENESCRYHPGHFDEDLFGIKGGFIGWSCCRRTGEVEPLTGFLYVNDAALDKATPGCCFSEVHTRDEEFARLISRFPFNPDNNKTIENFPSTSSSPLPTDLIKEEEESQNDDFFLHKVLTTDTLVGLSLRYNIPTKDIQRINRLTTDQVYTKKTLLIPKNANAKLPNPDDIAVLEESQRKLKHQRDFRRETSCSREESLYYLEESNYNYPESIQSWRSDREWEKADRMKKFDSMQQNAQLSAKGTTCCFFPEIPNKNN